MKLCWCKLIGIACHCIIHQGVIFGKNSVHGTCDKHLINTFEFKKGNIPNTPFYGKTEERTNTDENWLFDWKSHLNAQNLTKLQGVAYVITDIYKGKLGHFPTSQTIKKVLIPFLCCKETEQACNFTRQFVDLKGWTLWHSNFFTEVKTSTMENRLLWDYDLCLQTVQMFGMLGSMHRCDQLRGKTQKLYFILTHSLRATLILYLKQIHWCWWQKKKKRSGILTHVKG